MTFRDMHRPGDPFVLANAWDVGSARMLVAAGARAVGTTSAGYAFTRGLPDGGRVGRDETIAHAADLAAHVPVPVSVDAEDGWGPEPADCAETARLCGAAGLAGLSIEDVDGSGGAYGFAASVARIGAAAVACRQAPGDLVLCARADGVMHGAYDLDEAIRRVRAFREAGADVLYVPLPGDAQALRRVVRAVDAPVNALAVGPLAGLTMREMAGTGVARVSLGSALARATHRVIADAGHAIFGEGRLDAAAGMPGETVDAMLRDGA